MKDALRQVLHIIERSILPRAVDLRTAKGRLQIEVSEQRMLLAPRRDGRFLIDRQLAQEAPAAADLLRRGADAAVQQPDLLHAHREALLRHCARALHWLTSGADTVEWRVKALRTGERALKGPALPGFDAHELTALLAPGTATTAAPVQAGPETGPQPPSSPPARESDGTVAAFYRQIAARVQDAWLFEASGHPAGVPSNASSRTSYSELVEAAAHARAWHEDLPPVAEGPVMTVLVGPSRETIRCMAVDGEHVALLSCSGLELGMVLAGWRATRQIAEGS